MCDCCDWEELVTDIDEMLEEEDYEFATDTLEGIRGWIVDNEHCTDNQKDAVKNILYSK